MKAKWNDKDLDNLRLRLKYCVKEHLLDLVKIKGIGRMKAKQLYDDGIKDANDYMRYLKTKKENPGISPGFLFGIN